MWSVVLQGLSIIASTSQEVSIKVTIVLNRLFEKSVTLVFMYMHDYNMHINVVVLSIHTPKHICT